MASGGVRAYSKSAGGVSGAGNKEGYTVGKWFSAALAAAAGVLALAGGASAITGGSPTGPSSYTNVGALVGVAPDGTTKQFCSGTVISRTAFLTAAHCVEAILALPGARVAVTFDDVVTPSSTLIFGTPHIDPAYNQSQSDPQDLAVITFSSRLPANPVRVAPLGYLDTVSLKTATFTNVGYGVSDPVNAPKGPTIEGAGTRRFSTSTFSTLTKGLLKLTESPGGTCTGDSGGPQFLNGYEVSVTITGDTQCKATSVDQRLDTAASLAFLGPYLAH